MNREAVGIIAQIESAMVDRLKLAMPDIVVDAYPESPDKYQTLHNKGAVLVSYRNRNRIEDSATFCGLNESECFFNINILIRHLRQRDANQGAYDLLELIEEELHEWEPGIDGCGAFEFVRDGFIREDGGLWMYGMVFKLTVAR